MCENGWMNDEIEEALKIIDVEGTYAWKSLQTKYGGKEGRQTN